MASIQWHLLQSFAAELFFFSMSWVAMLEHSVEMYISLPKHIWNLISCFLHVILNYVNWNNSLYLLHCTIKVPVYLKNTYPTFLENVSYHEMKLLWTHIQFLSVSFFFFLLVSVNLGNQKEFPYGMILLVWFYDFIVNLLVLI